MAKVKSGKTDKPAKKSTAGIGAEREGLAKELRALIPRLDSEGLAFLVEQARVHLYNMQVDEFNQAAEARTVSVSRVQKPPKPVKDNFRIDGTESGSSYYLHYRNDEVMFSRDEMIHLVKMVNAGGTDLEIQERLYNWFDRERKDFFAAVPVADKFDDRLTALAALIKKTFKIRKG